MTTDQALDDLARKLVAAIDAGDEKTAGETRAAISDHIRCKILWCTCCGRRGYTTIQCCGPHN